jgi:hypothetical protein
MARILTTRRPFSCTHAQSKTASKQFIYSKDIFLKNKSIPTVNTISQKRCRDKASASAPPCAAA